MQTMIKTSTKNSSTTLLQIVIVCLGIFVLAFMLWEPHLEGRNINATVFQIYFNDPFLAYMYVASIPFFVALYKGLKVLRYAAKDKTFSEESIKALGVIKYCAMSIVGFGIGAEAFIMLNSGSDDKAGGVFIGLLIILISGVAVSAASMFERTLKRGVDMRPQNN